MRGRVLSPSHLLSVAAFCVGGGWLWNLTSTLQREPSGKDGAEASLRAGSHNAEEPASLTQAPQLWSNQSHKTEGEDRRWSGRLHLCLTPLGGPGAAGRSFTRPAPPGGSQWPGSPGAAPPALSSASGDTRCWECWERACPLRRGEQSSWRGCHTVSVPQSVATRLLFLGDFAFKGPCGGEMTLRFFMSGFSNLTPLPRLMRLGPPRP